MGAVAWDEHQDTPWNSRACLPIPSGAESGYPPSVLLLDILANVASDTTAGDGLFAALRRQFVEDRRTPSLDVRHALERRRKREAAARKSSHRGERVSRV